MRLAAVEKENRLCQAVEACENFLRRGEPRPKSEMMKNAQTEDNIVLFRRRPQVLDEFEGTHLVPKPYAISPIRIAVESASTPCARVTGPREGGHEPPIRAREIEHRTMVCAMVLKEVMNERKSFRAPTDEVPGLIEVRRGDRLIELSAMTRLRDLQHQALRFRWLPTQQHNGPRPSPTENPGDGQAVLAADNVDRSARKRSLSHGQSTAR
jgi:hypothetical protein